MREHYGCRGDRFTVRSVFQLRLHTCCSVAHFDIPHAARSKHPVVKTRSVSIECTMDLIDYCRTLSDPLRYPAEVIIHMMKVPEEKTKWKRSGKRSEQNGTQRAKVGKDFMKISQE